MAKDCFCGCGRSIPRFPLGMRATNKRGAQVADRITFAEQEGLRGHPDLVDWFRNGDAIEAALAEAVHGETDPRSLDESFVRQWQAEGRDIERVVNERYATLGQPDDRCRQP